MKLCVNGRWHTDVCRCFEYWTGNRCDRRLCAAGAGVLQPKDGLCKCRPGFGGEFCQFEICLHRNLWHCSAIELPTKSIWSESDDVQLDRTPQLCPGEVTTGWFQPPVNISPAWFCGCNHGHNREPQGQQTDLSGVCVCDDGYFGEFCQRNVCELNGTVWQPELGMCEDAQPPNVDVPMMGFFGMEINTELAFVVIIVFSLIGAFAVAGRCYLRAISRRHRLEDKLKKRRNVLVNKASLTNVGFGARHGNAKELVEIYQICSQHDDDSVWNRFNGSQKDGESESLLPSRNYSYKHFYCETPVAENASRRSIESQSIRMAPETPSVVIRPPSDERLFRAIP